MLMVPNLIWTKNKPDGYAKSETKENKVLLIFERIGQKQFVRVMGKDIDNPVVILFHGGPAAPDGIDDMRWHFTDIWQFGTEFDVPIYFISGEMDYICSRILAEQYYDDVVAPDKAFFEIKGCGHTPQADKPQRVADIIAGLGVK